MPCHPQPPPLPPLLLLATPALPALVCPNTKHKHSMTPGAGLPLLVTVAVDAIELSHPVVLDRDMQCRGQVRGVSKGKGTLLL